jgi:hypothetical protein
VLLLQLGYHLLLGPSIQQLKLFLLIPVRSAHLPPVGRLLVTGCHDRVLVRLALALLGWDGSSGCLRLCLPSSVEAVGIAVPLLDGSLSCSLRPARVLLAFEPIAVPNSLRSDLLELAGRREEELRLVRSKLLMVAAGTTQVRREGTAIVQGDEALRGWIFGIFCMLQAFLLFIV